MKQYYLFKGPYDGMPEYTSRKNPEGPPNHVRILPGFGQWCMISGDNISADAIPVESAIQAIENMRINDNNSQSN